MTRNPQPSVSPSVPDAAPTFAAILKALDGYWITNWTPATKEQKVALLKLVIAHLEEDVIRCKLLKDIDFQGVLRKAGTVLRVDEESESAYHIQLGHGDWITLLKGVGAIAYNEKDQDS